MVMDSHNPSTSFVPISTARWESDSGVGAVCPKEAVAQEAASIAVLARRRKDSWATAAAVRHSCRLRHEAAVILIEAEVLREAAGTLIAAAAEPLTWGAKEAVATLIAGLIGAVEILTASGVAANEVVVVSRQEAAEAILTAATEAEACAADSTAAEECEVVSTAEAVECGVALIAEECEEACAAWNAAAAECAACRSAAAHGTEEVAAEHGEERQDNPLQRLNSFKVWALSARQPSGNYKI